MSKIKIDYAKTFSERSEERINRITANAMYSLIFLLLTVMVIVNIEPSKPNAIVSKHVQVLNIVQSNIRSGFKEPLIYDLEHIVPALTQHGYTTKDYYIALRYFKSNDNTIKYKNGNYSSGEL